MASPTPKQLAYLKHLGVLDAPDTKERAGQWIDRIHDGTRFTAEQNADLQRQMASWASERSLKHPDLYPEDVLRTLEMMSAELSETKRSLKKAASDQDKEELGWKVKMLDEEIECAKIREKQEKEDIMEAARDVKQEQKDRMSGLVDDIKLYFSDEIRKPTQAQVRACVEELDRATPQWESEYPAELCDLLKIRFPDLAKNGASKGQRKGVKKAAAAGGSCIIVLAAFALPIVAGTVWLIEKLSI